MNPSTPLPWIKQDIDVLVSKPNFIIHSPHDTYSLQATQNSEYLIHACNSYPRLVEALREHAFYGTERGTNAINLLRELGEAK